jgi:hypothetical protein
MTKNWVDLTQAEKIEDLRNDVARIFGILTELRDAVAHDQSALKSRTDTMSARIDMISAWGQLLNQLQHRLNKLDGGI